MTSNCMPHKECCHTGENITDTDFGYTLSLINGKYKLIIIYWLAQHKPVMRYNELKRCLGTISHKTLSATLKEMENDSLIIRTEYPQIPPKVEYLDPCTSGCIRIIDPDSDIHVSMGQSA